MKPRADAKLKSMPQEQQDALCEWLTMENVTYSEARKRLASRFSVSTSLASLSDYYSSVAVPWKYARARGLADQLATMSEGSFDAATTKRLQALLFEMSVTNRVDLKAIKTLAKIVGDSHKLTLAQSRLELDKRKVKILEAKAEQADQAKGVAGDKNLSPQEKERRIKAVFGIT
jgi:hypothetical protein